MRREAIRLTLTAMMASWLGSGCGIEEHPHNRPGEVTIADSGGSTGSNPSTGGSSGSNPSPSTGGSSGGTSNGGATGSGGAGGSQAPGGQAGSGGAGMPSATGGTTGSNGGPPSAASITINGTVVPREKAIVILHFGHSNMEGRARSPASMQSYFYTKVPRLWAYKANNTFVEAVEPLSKGASSLSRVSRAGPGMALLKAAMAAAPADHHFISIGLGVSSSTTVDWLKGGLYYDDYVAIAKQLKGKVTFGFAAIMLGITDRHLPEAEQNGLADRVKQIVTDLRADLGEPNLPVVHTDYEVESTEELAVNGPVGMLFRPQIMSLPSKIDRLGVVPTDMLGMEDDHHFDFNGQKVWADRAVKIILDKGWAPWAAR